MRRRIPRSSRMLLRRLRRRTGAAGGAPTLRALLQLRRRQRRSDAALRQSRRLTRRAPLLSAWRRWRRSGGSARKRWRRRLRRRGREWRQRARQSRSARLLLHPRRERLRRQARRLCLRCRFRRVIMPRGLLLLPACSSRRRAPSAARVARRRAATSPRSSRRRRRRHSGATSRRCGRQRSRWTRPARHTIRDTLNDEAARWEIEHTHCPRHRRYRYSAAPPSGARCTASAAPQDSDGSGKACDTTRRAPFPRGSARSSWAARWQRCVSAR